MRGTPGEDGAQIVAALRELEGRGGSARALVAIAMTGQVARAGASPTDRALFAARLTKPVALPALLAAIVAATKGGEASERGRTRQLLIVMACAAVR